MKFLGIIPARYHSTRLPGKPLANICGKPMIQWVYEKSMQALPDVYVATDDARVAEAVEKFGGNVVMTRINHENGTSRCLEAFEKITSSTGKRFDVVVNIQGDEPMLNPESIHQLMQCFDDVDTSFATLAMAATEAEELETSSDVWVVMNKAKEAMYFSRSVIPFVRNLPRHRWIEVHCHYKHIGLYAYTSEALRAFATMPPSPLENFESLEQLRWLQNGGRIKVGITQHKGVSVDTPEDLAKVIALLS